MPGTLSPQRTLVGRASDECFDTSAFTLPNHRVADKQKRKKQHQAELAMREMTAAAAPQPATKLASRSSLSAELKEGRVDVYPSRKPAGTGFDWLAARTHTENQRDDDLTRFEDTINPRESEAF
jgi:hypothetical protein